ncbi:hypothetical protein [Pseudarthrobacter sp. CC12]
MVMQPGHVGNGQVLSSGLNGKTKPPSTPDLDDLQGAATFVRAG